VSLDPYLVPVGPWVVAPRGLRCAHDLKLGAEVVSRDHTMW
jgi:hypothetical protein